MARGRPRKNAAAKPVPVHESGEPTLRARVGENIKTIRIKNHLKQADLAEMLDVTPTFLSAVERGVSGISMELLEKLCRKLNTSADCFLFGQKETVGEEIERLNLTIQNQNFIIKSLMSRMEPLDILGALVSNVGMTKEDVAALLGNKSAQNSD